MRCCSLPGWANTELHSGGVSADTPCDVIHAHTLMYHVTTLLRNTSTSLLPPKVLHYLTPNDNESVYEVWWFKWLCMIYTMSPSTTLICLFGWIHLQEAWWLPGTAGTWWLHFRLWCATWAFGQFTKIFFWKTKWDNWYFSIIYFWHYKGRVSRRWFTKSGIRFFHLLWTMGWLVSFWCMRSWTSVLG